MEACKDKQFYRQVETFNVDHMPNFEITASVLMMRLKEKLTSAIVDLGSDDVVEFCMMCALGLFKRKDELYEMAIPKCISSDCVKQVALKVAKSERHFHLCPERLVVNMPRRKAVALQKRILKKFFKGGGRKDDT